MNKAITRTIPMNLNSPGGDQYTQNHPQRDTNCKQTYVLPFVIFWSLFRTQNLSYLMNKYLNIYPVPYFIYSSLSVLVPEHPSSLGEVLPEQTTVNLEKTRVWLISGVMLVTVDPFVHIRGPLELALSIDVLLFPIQSTYY